MTEKISSFQEAISKCLDCPVQCEDLAEHATLVDDWRILEKIGIDIVVNEDLDVVQYCLENGLEIVNDKQELINNIENRIAIKRLEINNIQQQIVEIANKCSGIAVAKTLDDSGASYTVSICTSSDLYDDRQGHNHVPAHVTKLGISHN